MSRVLVVCVIKLEVDVALSTVHAMSVVGGILYENLSVVAAIMLLRRFPLSSLRNNSLTGAVSLRLNGIMSPAAFDYNCFDDTIDYVRQPWCPIPGNLEPLWRPQSFWV